MKFGMYHGSKRRTPNCEAVRTKTANCKLVVGRFYAIQIFDTNSSYRLQRNHLLSS